MNTYESQARLLKALMKPARLSILEVLRIGEACVGDMEAVLGYRQAYISQQLMVLREAGLMVDGRDGWNIFYRIRKPEIFEVLDAARAVVGKSAKSHLMASVKSCTCPHCTGEVSVVSGAAAVRA